jgi:hypothetical protein
MGRRRHHRELDMAGLVTQADKDFVEVWESVTNSTHFIIKLNFRNEEEQVAVEPRQRVTLTTQDRLITSSRVREVKNNPFLNGSFRPLTVPDSVTVETNPNALSDDDIRRIFASSDVAWDEYTKTITSESTLHRMLQLAEDDESITVKRLKQITAAYLQAHPKRKITNSDKVLNRFLYRDGVGGATDED